SVAPPPRFVVYVLLVSSCHARRPPDCVCTNRSSVGEPENRTVLPLSETETARSRRHSSDSTSRKPPNPRALFRDRLGPETRAGIRFRSDELTRMRVTDHRR